MTQVSTVPDIIELWPTRAALAADISAENGLVSVGRIHKWAQTGMIPAQYHWGILQAAKRRGFCLTAEDLARVHDRTGRDAA